MQKPSNLRIVFALCVLAWVVIVGRAIFLEQPKRENVTSNEELITFAKATLDGLQERSFSQNREYCGLIFENEDGALSTSEIAMGGESECGFSWQVPMDKYAIASFHTHGGFDVQYDGEAPSMIDLQTDFEDRIDGFISTPGGRVWHIEWDEETATQLCGEQCVEQDPKYEPCLSFLPVEKYGLQELRQRIEGDSGNCL